MIVWRKLRIFSALMFFFSCTVGCSSLPSFGPSRGDIYDSVGQEERDGQSQNPLGFQVVDITPQIINGMRQESNDDLKQFANLGQPRPADLIVAGDVLSVSVFEAGAGLFGIGLQPVDESSTGAVASGSVSSTTIPHITVTRDGTIYVPYAGKITASGQTTSQLAASIRKRLEGKAAQPQVLVERVVDVGNRVVILGDVQKPGRYLLTLAHERLLDLIAEAAGPTHPDRETQVTIFRQGKKAAALLSTIARASSEDTVLQPGDRLELDYNPKTFLVFGAASRQTEIPFTTEHVSLAEGLSRANGLEDFQADPRGVFIFRFEEKETAAKIGKEGDKRSTFVPIVYHISLLAPESFFLLQFFELKNKDIIYISDAPSVKIQKLLGILNGVFSPVANTRNVVQ